MKMASLEFKEDIERNLTSEQKAQLAEHMQKQTLLRAAKMESEPEQELLRPATDVGETNSGELLRSSDKYPFKNNLRFSR